MSFLNAVKSSAVDCVLNNDVNNQWLDEKDKIKCFEFNENEITKAQITQAYKLNIYDDLIIDNGQNANSSYSIDEQLIEIEASIENKDGTVDNNYNKYWLNRKTGVVYDYEDYYVIGTVKKEQGIIINYNGKFIIDKLVFYPIVQS